MSSADHREVGRPALEDDLIKTISNLVVMGVPPESAAGAMDVAPLVHKEWMEDGEANGRGHYKQRRYYLAMTKAVAQCEAQLVSKIRTAANENWQAAAWLAERRFPEKYVRRSVNDEKIPSTPVAGNPFADLDNVTPMRRPRRNP